MQTLKKENSVLYVNTKFNYTSQVEYKFNRAQYKFPVPVQLMEVLKVVAFSG